MKKTKVVTTKAKVVPASKKEVTKTHCDFCDKVVPDHGSYGWYPSCSLCGRDCCRDHNRPDPHEYGDYPDWFCDICYELRYDTHKDEYLSMVKRHEKEKETFMKKLKKVSLSENTNDR